MKGIAHIAIVFCIFSIFSSNFVLQVEVDDDTGADVASNISNKSQDAVDSGLPDVRQVTLTLRLRIF